MFNATGKASVWSPVARLTLLGSLPGTSAITGPAGTIANVTPTITWTAAPNAATYELRLTNIATRATTDLTGLTGNSYTPTSDLAAGKYSAQVRVFNATGQTSAWSSAPASRSWRWCR